MLFITYADWQPVVQQVREVLDDYSSQWAKSDNQIKQDMDAMLELQRMKLQLECDRLDFEREKAGLGKSQPKANGTFSLYGLCNCIEYFFLCFLHQGLCTAQ